MSNVTDCGTSQTDLCNEVSQIENNSTLENHNKGRVAFLDLLIQATLPDGSKLNDSDIQEEVYFLFYFIFIKLIIYSLKITIFHRLILLCLKAMIQQLVPLHGLCIYLENIQK